MYICGKNVRTLVTQGFTFWELHQMWFGNKSSVGPLAFLSTSCSFKSLLVNRSINPSSSAWTSFWPKISESYYPLFPNQSHPSRFSFVPSLSLSLTLILPLAPRLRMSWDSASPSSTARWPNCHQIVTIVKKIIFKVINRKSSRSVSLNWNKAKVIGIEILNFPTAGWDHQASDGGSLPKPNKPPSPSSSCRRSSGQIYLDADVCGKINVKNCAIIVREKIFWKSYPGSILRPSSPGDAGA